MEKEEKESGSEGGFRAGKAAPCSSTGVLLMLIETNSPPWQRLMTVDSE
jgi:hypothetical protein